MIYKPELAAHAREMCRLGATDEDLAEYFAVNVRTIYRWRGTHEEFDEAMAIGKEHADARVASALYARAVGCSVERTRIVMRSGDLMPVYATYTQHLPPDPVAALHWLRLRQTKIWPVREEDSPGPTPAEMVRKVLACLADHQPPSRSSRRSPAGAAAPKARPDRGRFRRSRAP